MNDINYEEYDFNVKGIIEVNSTEGILKITTSGLKETLIRIQATNVLRKAGKNITSKIKGDKVLEELVQKIPGEIEVLSHKIIE
ncbi:hypothetical protein [Aliarcobacter butzleri]|uniref:hypothetical protein n=1 Tax=Aliarcobacter butzleri TaxID=28197 RepID=UPI0021B480CF|nr:hypothetical protein [Aliarcobacter butzleri]MCT7620485.1 hypothetical protein [Aliarcobacter butzleri]